MAGGVSVDQSNNPIILCNTNGSMFSENPEGKEEMVLLKLLSDGDQLPAINGTFFADPEGETENEIDPTPAGGKLSTGTVIGLSICIPLILILAGFILFRMGFKRAELKYAKMHSQQGGDLSLEATTGDI